jgi:hypothetical protein
MTTRAARRAAQRRAILVAGAAAICLAIAASAPAAAPSYGDWSAPVSVAGINTAAREAGPALSEDGVSLYFESDRPGGVGGTDIWVAHRPAPDAPWGTPVNLGATINSPVNDMYPTLTPDGRRLFFSSARSGGFGNLDIYQAVRVDVHDDLGWQAPTNLGPPINTSLSDNGAFYFENPGGRPQLYFGSGPQPGGLGERDLYVSEQQTDGSWGPPAWIPQFASVFTETHPTVRRDGLEIIFHRGTAPGVSPTELMVATRPSIDVPWSAPVKVAEPVNLAAAADLDPYLSADGRTLVYGSNRAGSLGSIDLYTTTRTAPLTVTADDQSRLFGHANPTLSYAITGFVGGDTSAVVSGTAACSTTATPSSPAGNYPITCAVGSLGAPGYVFDSFVAGTLRVRYSRPCLTGSSAGPLHVGAGEAVCIGAGGSQAGAVTVAPGGSLDVEGGRITGPVVADSAAVVRICGATITGPLTISGSTGPVLVGGEGCDPNTVVGPVRVIDNAAGVDVNANRVTGPFRVTGNAVPVHVSGNAVTGPAVIQS